MSPNFLSDLRTNFTKFELSTTFRAQDMQQVRFLLERLFSFRWVYTVSVIRTFFVPTENASAFFLRTYMQTIYADPFFVVRTKAPPQILRTHLVEHGSTFVRFRTYQ